jgi:peroxiredoxin
MASRISKTWLIRVTLIIAVLALIGIALGCSSPSPSGTKAPDFTLPTLTGANITLSELEGTPVVLNFWTTTCPYCVQQLPYLEDVAQQRQGEINVIATNIGQNASTVQSFVQSFFGNNETTMIVALDSNGEVFVNYCQNYGNLEGRIPFTLFVDSVGIVKYVKVGAFASEAALQNTIDSVF